MKVVAVAGGVDSVESSDEPVEVLSQESAEEKGEVDKSVRGFTEEYLATMNQVLAQQPLSAVLEWCCKSLPNFYQVTSFGSAGVVIIHELHKLNLNVCLSESDGLHCITCFGRVFV
jgi:hypothetical protein